MAIIKSFIKLFIPEALQKRLRPFYHGMLAWDANIFYDRPSLQLVVIGVTGTAGKSTTIQLLAQMLNFNGKKTGYITTVEFFDGRQIFINKHGLSMSSETKLQKDLKTMLGRGCKYAIIECTSEGLAQNRHLGINFDVVFITNLSHAHIDAHGSYDNYKAAKAKLFLALQKSRKKSFFPQKILGVNLDSGESREFLKFTADKKFGVTLGQSDHNDEVNKVYSARVLNEDAPANFEIQHILFESKLLGNFNIRNALMAAACANSLGVDLVHCADALRAFPGIRGRMEEVPNNFGFRVIVDYGCEPASFLSALEAVKRLPHNNIIHVFGSTGGHRDTNKRFIFGEGSAKIADSIIVTNDDVYNSDPQQIAANIAEGIGQVPSEKLKVKSVETILDRRQAIAKALLLARKDDIVLITGKGSEQFLVLPGNKRIDWDEVTVVREELHKLVLGIKN